MTLELYPASAHDAFHGTGLQFPQHVDEAVQQIHGACQGLGTDEKTLITVLGSKSPETRNLIALRYKELYQKPLKSLMKSETSGDFGRLLRMISTPLAETEAQVLRDATKGMGTTESLVIQILSGRSNEEMSILKRTYFDLVGKDLAVTMNSELSGDFRKVVMALLQSSQVPYNPAVHNAAKAEEEAVALYKAGQGRLGTNEEVFIGILVKAPPEFLKMMDAVYVAKYSNNIAKAVDKEFSGDAKKSLNYLVRSVMDPYPAIAEVFEKTMKGFGTDETGLSTALVRYQSVLPYVKVAYKKQYHEELRDRISGETSGDYKRLLLEVFDAPLDSPKPKGFKGAQGATVPFGSGASQQYLATQTSYTAPSSSSQHPAQDYSASASYSAPAGHHAYGQSFQSPPAQAAYGSSPNQPPISQPAGYSPQQGSSYPGQSSAQAQGQAPSYPTPQQPSGYAPHQEQHQPPSYASSQQTSGYPPQQQQHQQQAYNPQQQYSQQHHNQQSSYSTQPGYPVPQQQQQPGYPPQHQSSYPPPQSQPAYPPHQQPSYSSQPGYPPQQQSGYPSQQPGYPPQQSGYPPQQSGYPPQQSGYPPQQQPSYPPQSYPPQQSGYPPQQTGYPPQQTGYPPQQYPPSGQPSPYGSAPPTQGNYPPSGAYQQQYPPPGGYPPYRGV